ncbi:thioesterase [Streptomyces sp. 5-8]|uniref:Thioesterase n=1 Tax=Streptomyces musisoli TaxID=2802280 RepID=A0ABS1NV10_9ACTN|nr:alpha/beta fold hydrolase [Streptomyces musisoli]MBL1103940.1 thioesterase [Streptomyces musisoli]
MADKSPWLVRRRRRPEASLRLYCFPHSGGSPGEYVRWADELPDVEVWGIQPPGRGTRVMETPLDSIDTFVQGLVESVDFAGPFVFFGHSLGGLTAFETARALRAAGRPLPERLVLSAYPAPHLPHPRSPLHTLGDDELLAAVNERYGGLPAPLLADPELVRLVLPAYRADFTIFETYQHVRQEPLDIPISVLGGESDLASPYLPQWREHTTAECTVELFPGGHFYLREHPEAFMQALRKLI